MQKINLFSTHFKCGNAKRQKELDYCLEQNKANELIENIFLFDDRPHYNDFFSETQKYPGDINILANADIYFNQTLEYVRHIKQGQAYAITRWEEVGGQLTKFENRNAYNRHAQARFSQDVWVLPGAAKQVNGSFYIGVPGCDNRIAHEMSRHYQVFNPCETIQCVHKHDDPGREYNIPEGSLKRISRPWKWVSPCSIGSDGKITEWAKTGRRAV